MSTMYSKDNNVIKENKVQNYYNVKNWKRIKVWLFLHPFLLQSYKLIWKLGHLLSLRMMNYDAAVFGSETYYECLL